MEIKLIARSRYGDDRFAIQLLNDVFIIYGVSHYARGGETMFDFEGGPCITEGFSFNFNGKEFTVSKIVHMSEEDYGLIPEGKCGVKVVC